jgi:hypothetical protein
LTADIANIQREAQREFQRGMLMSGPGELLRKLASVQLSRNGMTSGSFLGMDEGLRKDVMERTGGFALASARRQLGLLGGAPTSEFNDEPYGGRMKDIGIAQARVRAQMNMGGLTEGNLPESITTTVNELTKLAGATSTLYQEFERLSKFLSTRNNAPGGVPSEPQAFTRN